MGYCNRDSTEKKGSVPQMKLVGKVILGAIFTIFIGLPALFGSWYTVSEGNRGVVTRNNAFQEVSAPGLHFKMPWIDSVTEMSVQTQKVTYENIAAYSKDIQQSKNVVAINYSLKPEAVGGVYSRLGTGYMDRVVPNNLQDRLKQVFGQYSAADIIYQRERVTDEIEALIRKDLIEYGIVVEDLQITNIDFSDVYEHAVEAAAKAQAEVKTATQQLERVKVDAQRRVAEAEANALATRAAADASAYEKQKLGEAEAAAIAARGKALRDNPSLVELVAAEKWNGALPTQMIPGSTVPFVSLGK